MKEEVLPKYDREGVVKERVEGGSQEQILAGLRDELANLELQMGGAVQGVDELRAENGAMDPDVVQLGGETAALLKRRQALVMEIRRISGSDGVASHQGGMQSEVNPVRESARELEEKVEQEFVALEKSLSNAGVALKVGRKVEPMYNTVLSLDDRLANLSTNPDRWIDAYLSPSAKAMEKELREFGYADKRLEKLKAAYADRLKKEMPPEFAAIDRFFEQKALEYFGDRASAQFLKNKVLDNGTKVTDMDDPSKTPQLQQIAEYGLKFIARTLKLPSQDLSQVTAGYKDFMGAWDARTEGIEQSIVADYDSQERQLKDAYQAEVKTVKESDAFQKDMALIARTRAVVEPLVARYQFVAPPKKAQPIEATDSSFRAAA
ncbi:hypothetical protein KBB85_02130 [Patescibacteria group bacterium]|nr:hypothetical protein [Patescibacteria group bacterium]